MWILSSMGRPDRIRKLVDSYDWGAGHSPVLLTLAERDARLHEYLSQEWPASWRIEIVQALGNGPTYNEILLRYPDEPCYGFLADDQILETSGMLVDLELAACDWNVAYANDKHHGESIPTMPCLGGELVRAVGYLSPRTIIHWGIDCCWYEIGKRLGTLRYQPDLTYEHQNPVWGTAPDDRTYRLARQRSFGYTDYLRGWMFGGELENAVARVNERRGVAALSPRLPGQADKPLAAHNRTEQGLSDIVRMHIGESDGRT